MRFVFLLPIVALAAGGLGACSSPAPDTAAEKPAPGRAPDSPLGRRGGPFRQQWAMDSLWENGQAEVATYYMREEVEGEPREFETTRITAKTEFSQPRGVETTPADRQHAFPVLKVVQASSVPTAGGTRHLLTTQFFRRDQPTQLHQLTVSTQEDWYGASFQILTDDGLQYQQTYHSYRTGTGLRQLRREVLFEDALPFTLRSLRFEQRPAFAVPVYESGQTARGASPALYQARVKVEEAPADEAPQPAWRVTVALAAGKQNVYWFGRQYPNLLLRQTTWDGRTLHLKQVRRTAYQPAADTTARPPEDAMQLPAGR